MKFFIFITSFLAMFELHAAANLAACKDELPVDYRHHKCTWSCAKYAGINVFNRILRGKSYCEDDWSQHANCIPYSKGLISGYCKASCGNCGCPALTNWKPGVYGCKGTCINDNKGYLDFETAWNECGKADLCGKIMKHVNGKFYLRRLDDTYYPKSHSSYVDYSCGGCWEQRNGYYVKEGHGQVNECYDTLETAKRFCLAAGDCKAIATQSNICSGKYRVTHGDPTFISYAGWKQYNLKAYEYMCYSECWNQRTGDYVQEGHGETNECYATLEEAKLRCIAAGDCRAIARQSNICGGKFRVAHGSPTFIKSANGWNIGMRAFEYTCNTGYYSGVAGGVCNDANHVIRSQKECSDGLQVLDITSLAISWTGKSDGIPSGCSFSKRKTSQQSYLSPHFETSTTGLGKGRNDLTPICKKPMDYYVGTVGKLCDNENDVIRSKDECISALLAYGFKTSDFWTGTLGHTVPSGCSIRYSGDTRPHFEQSSTGMGNARNDLIPICKKTRN